MSYIIFAWIASIVYGLEVVIGKFATKYTIENPWLLNFVWSFFIIILILPFALANHVAPPRLTISFLLVSFLYALVNILYVISLKLVDVTVMGPLFNFRSVFSVILGVIMLGEKISPWQIVLIGVIFIGGILVNIDEKFSLKNLLKPGLLVVMAFLFALSLLGVYTNISIAESGYWSVTLWSMVLAQVMMLATAPLFWRDLLKTHVKKYSGLFAMSLASAGATLAANIAYAANVGITSIILSLPFSMIMTIAISFVKPKLLEHHSAKVYFFRVSAAAVMIVAALKLTE